MKKSYYSIILILLLTLGIKVEGQVTYDKQNISLLSNWFNPNEPIATSYNIKYNGIWGWADTLGNEYAIVGAASGTYFINVTNPAVPVQCDWVKGRRNNCIWREIKTYKQYCYMVSDDSSPNSLQIVDMSYLPDSVHVVYDSNALFERCHTIYIEGDKLYGGYIHGGTVGSASMAVFSLANPTNPVLLRTLNQDYSLPGGSVHDMYVSHDTIFASCGYDGLYIYKLLSNNHFNYINSLVTYIDQGYNHATALTNDAQNLVMTDEVPLGLDVKIVDVSNLNNLSVSSNFHTHPDATAHNPFILGNLLYMAYYMDGLQVFDISNPFNPVRVGYFDTYWQNTPGLYPSPGYAGAWGAYPFLPSGNILVSDMQNGLFVLDVSVITAINNTAKKQTFSIHPNPVLKGNKITIALSNVVEKELMIITDITGREVQRKIVSGNINTIDTSLLPAGIYSLTIYSEGKLSTGRFIIGE